MISELSMPTTRPALRDRACVNVPATAAQIQYTLLRITSDIFRQGFSVLRDISMPFLI